MEADHTFLSRRSPNGEFACAVATSFLLHAACFVLLAIPLLFIGSALGRQGVEIDVVQIAAAETTEYHASDPIGDHSDQTGDNFGDELEADALPGEFNFEYAAAEVATPDVPMFILPTVSDIPLFDIERKSKPVVMFTTLSKPVSLTSPASNRSGVPIKRTTSVLCRNFEEYKAIVEKWEFRRVPYKPSRNDIDASINIGEWGEWVFRFLTQDQVDQFDRRIFGPATVAVGYIPGVELKSEQHRFESKHPGSTQFEYILTPNVVSLVTWSPR